MTSPTPDVTRTDDGGLATITLQNPGLSGRSRAALTAAFRDVAQDSSVRAVVLTGSGRAFCVGQDLAEHIEALRADPARAFTGIGLSSDSALAARLVHCLGASRATELMLFPEPFSAETALEWGLVHRVTEPGQVLAEAQALGRRLAQGPTVAYRAVKTVLASAATDSLQETLASEARLQASLGPTADHREAVEAFLAKRKPSFTGQ